MMSDIVATSHMWLLRTFPPLEKILLDSTGRVSHSIIFS